MKRLIPTILILILTSALVYADALQDGWTASQRKDYKTAYKLWLPLAEQGSAKAQYLLGVLYGAGKGVPLNHSQSVKWMRLASKQGFAEAQYYFGTMYQKGQGVPEDHKEAVRFP